MSAVDHRRVIVLHRGASPSVQDQDAAQSFKYSHVVMMLEQALVLLWLRAGRAGNASYLVSQVVVFFLLIIVRALEPAHLLNQHVQCSQYAF